MQLWKVRTEVTNTVNDEEYVQIKYFGSESEAKEFEAEIQTSVDEWNKPEPSGGYGGKMSIRYLSSEIHYVDEDTDLGGLDFGTLTDIIKAVVKDWNDPSQQ